MQVVVMKARRNIIGLLMAELGRFLLWSINQSYETEDDQGWNAGYCAGMSAASGRLISALYRVSNPISLSIECQRMIQISAEWECNSIHSEIPVKYGYAYIAGYMTVSERMASMLLVEMARYEAQAVISDE